ncbi:hypothetical protein F4801DRAFT_300028 [Xylaria longipes]|nr:hypothetical protein F4801DRAFT_300028 [Xylaria longipes]
MGKISEETAKQLNERREELSKFQHEVQKAKDTLQKILDEMDEVTQQTIVSSSNAARQRRGKSDTESNFQRLIDNQQTIIDKLEQDILNTEKELQELDELFG